MNRIAAYYQSQPVVPLEEVEEYFSDGYSQGYSDGICWLAFIAAGAFVMGCVLGSLL